MTDIDIKPTATTDGTPSPVDLELATAKSDAALLIFRLSIDIGNDFEITFLQLKRTDDSDSDPKAGTNTNEAKMRDADAR